MIDIDLTRKISLVTGATGQLGRVIAARLAEAGSDVALQYHGNREKAEELVTACMERGVRAVSVQADVTDLNSVRAMGDEVSRQLGMPDIIVNNAVIQCYPWNTVLDEDEESYTSQYRSCVLHNVFMAKVFVPAMMEKNWGRVIGINTECAMQAAPTTSAYTSGKRGMDGILRVLAKEVGQHQITVNQVAPGWMISDKYRETGEESQPGYEQNVPLRRRGEDRDIANAVVFLASDLAQFITGTYLPVCGGNVMPCI